jgi:ribulose-phosphate 3-epimerase
MTVNPGFGGQSFINSMIDKIKRTRRMINESNKNILLEIDGGVKLDNALELSNLGVDILVAGSAIFGAEDIIKRTMEFKDLFVK